MGSDPAKVGVRFFSSYVILLAAKNVLETMEIATSFQSIYMFLAPLFLNLIY